MCLDGSDDKGCSYPATEDRFIDPPILVELRRRGPIAKRHMAPERFSVHEVCPDTHFWCPGRHFCVPVFVRCNGVYDCPGHEDEEGCDEYKCPGFYRCRASKVCVHVTQVCDDWPLCPQHDDELFCDQQCPVQCVCQGLAFLCSQSFPAQQFPDLRYLDMRGTGASMHQLGDNHMLIHLSLARCGLRVMSNVTFENLCSLDLSDNLLTEVSVRHFVNMPRLTVLFLSSNPLTSVVTDPTGSSSEVAKMHTLDLSFAQMPSVNKSLFAAFPNLQSLNLSHSGVQLLRWKSTQTHVVSLRELDLRGCEISEMSLGVLRGFLQLQRLHVENPKLCCSSMLPPGFNPDHCHAMSGDMFSCDNLLSSVTYRTVVAVLATLALFGNVSSLTMRVCLGSTWRLSSGGVVLTHLSVADLGTGLYLTTLGLADRLLAGPYVWQDDAWRKGAVCHLAGVLALSCRLAVSFFILLLSLGRCFCRCPALNQILTPAKAKVMSTAVWVSSFVLALIPLMTQWQFFGQQALCVPLPHKRSGSLESHYAYGIMVLLNFILFVVCFMCEVVSGVCSRIAKPTIMNQSSEHSQFVVFGSLTSGFLYTIASLVTTDSYTDSERVVHTALVYFGSVASCAMNPYLHVYGVRAERSRRIKKERLMRIVSRTRV